MTTAEKTKALATEMGVSTNDLKNFAEMVVSSFEQDNVSQNFLEGDDARKEGLATSYAIYEALKFSRFADRVLTNKAASEAFAASVFDKLK